MIQFQIFRSGHAAWLASDDLATVDIGQG